MCGAHERNLMLGVRVCVRVSWTNSLKTSAGCGDPLHGTSGSILSQAGGGRPQKPQIPNCGEAMRAISCFCSGAFRPLSLFHPPPPVSLRVPVLWVSAGAWDMPRWGFPDVGGGGHACVFVSLLFI